MTDIFLPALSRAPSPFPRIPDTQKALKERRMDLFLFPYSMRRRIPYDAALTEPVEQSGPIQQPFSPFLF